MKNNGIVLLLVLARSFLCKNENGEVVWITEIDGDNLVEFGHQRDIRVPCLLDVSIRDRLHNALC